MKEKIDIILPSLAIGGAEKVMLLLAKQFKKNNFEVRFIVRNLTEKGFQDEVFRDFELVNLDVKKVRSFPRALLKKYSEIEKPDTIIASLWPLTFLTAVVIKVGFSNIKVLCIEHGSLKYQTRSKGKIYKLFLKYSLMLSIKLSNSVICVSSGLQKEISNITSYRGTKLISIPNPIEFTVENKFTSIPKIFDFTRNAHIFLSVGRLKKVKNIPLLLRAFEKVIKHLDAYLIILGDGPEIERLKDLCETLGIKDRVHFEGFQKDCISYYKFADTFVLSSDSEGFGNVLVEALSQGCTIVSTNCPYGPKEILNDGQFGYLAEVNNVDNLAENMIKAVRYPHSKDILKARADTYLPENIFKQYLAVLRAH